MTDLSPPDAAPPDAAQPDAVHPPEPAPRRGPDRPELWVRLGMSVVILVLIGVALSVHGIPEGPGLVEVLGVGGLFGGVVGWKAARGLWRG